MYYITSTHYVGPNRDQYPDEHWIDIQTEPPTTNSSLEVRTEGWLGTTNDWARYAHGEFDTFEDAKAALQAMLFKPGTPLEQGFRTVDPEEEPWDLEDGGIEARYKVGMYEQFGPTASLGTCCEELDALTGTETDEQIEALVDDIEVGMKVNFQAQIDKATVLRAFFDRRDEKRDEADD